MNSARKFSPIFVATITPANVETKTSARGDDYLICSSAQFVRPGQEPQVRTVMAFGQSATNLRDLLVAGQPVDLAVQFDGGTVKMIGTPRERQVAAAPKSAPRARSMPKDLLAACVEAGGFDQNERWAA